MKVGPNLHVEILHTAEERDRWLPMAEASEWADLHQCPWWSEPLSRYGVRTSILAVFREREIIGGGLFRIAPAIIPGFSTAECLDGPVFSEWDPAVGPVFVRGLRRLARRARALHLTMAGCRRTDVHEPLVLGLERAPGAVRLVSDHPHAFMRLAGRTWRDIEAGFNRRTRTALRKAAENGLTVRRLQTDEELRQAHGTWLATGARKGFADIRPWKALQPVLRRSVDQSFGYVLASCLNDEVLAAIFFTCFGRAGRCVYAGHQDRARSLFATHVLQVTAMQICLERSLETYDLDVLSPACDTTPDGVDEYKLGFGTTVTRWPHRIVWERFPRLCRAADYLHRQTLLKKGVAALKRRLIQRGE